MEPKKTFYVKMPFAGYVGLEVEADDEDGAIEAFHERWGQSDISGLGDPSLDMSWEFMDRIVQGNVCYAEQVEVEVEELD